MAAALIEIVDRSHEGVAAPNTIARLILGVVGSAMVFSAFGLWLVPGSDLPELSLIKLGLSLFTLIGGMCCLVAARKPRP